MTGKCLVAMSSRQVTAWAFLGALNYTPTAVAYLSVYYPASLFGQCLKMLNTYALPIYMILDIAWF